MLKKQTNKFRFSFKMIRIMILFVTLGLMTFLFACQKNLLEELSQTLYIEDIDEFKSIGISTMEPETVLLSDYFFQRNRHQKAFLIGVTHQDVDQKLTIKDSAGQILSDQLISRFNQFGSFSIISFTNDSAINTSSFDSKYFNYEMTGSRPIFYNNSNTKTYLINHHNGHMHYISQFRAFSVAINFMSTMDFSITLNHENHPIYFVSINEDDYTLFQLDLTEDLSFIELIKTKIPSFYVDRYHSIFARQTGFFFMFKDNALVRYDQTIQTGYTDLFYTYLRDAQNVNRIFEFGPDYVLQDASGVKDVLYLGFCASLVRLTVKKTESRHYMVCNNDLLELSYNSEGILTTSSLLGTFVGYDQTYLVYKDANQNIYRRHATTHVTRNLYRHDRLSILVVNHEGVIYFSTTDTTPATYGRIDLNHEVHFDVSSYERIFRRVAEIAK